MEKRKIVRRIYRVGRMSAEEAAAVQETRRKIMEEFPPKKRPVPDVITLDNLRHLMAELRKARTEGGLSLADVKERSGIDKPTLSRLENLAYDNPTIGTLVRYAQAVGKKIQVVLRNA